MLAINMQIANLRQSPDVVQIQPWQLVTSSLGRR